MIKMNESILIPLCGRIDSVNAADVENDIQRRIPGENVSLTLDASELASISSAGLRILLKIKKTNPYRIHAGQDQPDA